MTLYPDKFVTLEPDSIRHEKFLPLPPPPDRLGRGEQTFCLFAFGEAREFSPDPDSPLERMFLCDGGSEGCP